MRGGRGEKIQIPLKAGHHRPVIKMAFWWRADDDQTLNAGLGSSLIGFVRMGV